MAKYRILKPSRFDNAGKIYQIGEIVDGSLLGKMKPGENLELIEEEEEEEEEEVVVPSSPKPATPSVKPPAKPPVKK